MSLREQFEKWWEDHNGFQPRESWEKLYSPENDYYADEDIDQSYSAWKGAKKSTTVQLPHPFAWSPSGVKYYSEDQVQDILKQGGLNYVKSS